MPLHKCPNLFLRWTPTHTKRTGPSASPRAPCLTSALLSTSRRELLTALVNRLACFSFHARSLHTAQHGTARRGEAHHSTNVTHLSTGPCVSERWLLPPQVTAKHQSCHQHGVTRMLCHTNAVVHAPSTRMLAATNCPTHAVHTHAVPPIHSCSCPTHAILQPPHSTEQH